MVTQNIFSSVSSLYYEICFLINLYQCFWWRKGFLLLVSAVSHSGLAFLNSSFLGWLAGNHWAYTHSLPCRNVLVYSFCCHIPCWIERKSSKKTAISEWDRHLFGIFLILFLLHLLRYKNESVNILQLFWISDFCSYFVSPL